MLRRFTVLSAFVILHAVPLVAQLTEPLRVGIVYRNAALGTRMFNGIREAFDEYSTTTGTPVELVPFSYDNEDSGLQKTLAAVVNGAVDVILGPTDSGVFAALQGSSAQLETNRVLILSPVITAKLGNDRAGWLFRTNVTVRARAARIYDELVQRGFRTMAVVHEGTAFGDSAQAAFGRQTTSLRDADYLALRYAQPAEIRDVVKRVVAMRPGAVGLFGSREHLAILRRELREVDHGWASYDPQLFSIVDMRTVCIDDVLFVSVADPDEVDCDAEPSEMRDELTDLGYDTAIHLLRVAHTVEGNPSSADWRERFRDRLAASLEIPGRPLPRTGMVFSRMENTAAPALAIFRASAEPFRGTVESPPTDEHNWFMDRVNVRIRRFGLTPVLHLLLVTGIVALLSFADVRRTHTGPWWRFVWRWTFLKFALFNMLLAGTVLFVLAEFGSNRWDNTWAAFGVAFGYTMLLKATIFETKAGQTIGLAKFYDDIVEDINKQLRVLRAELEGPRFYFMAYTNSLTRLKHHFDRLSGNPDDPTQHMAEVQAEVDNQKEEIDKRVVYAKEILDLWKWRQLQRAGIVPYRMMEHELFDPANVLWKAADHSQLNPEINQAVEGHLAGKKSASELRKELEDRVAEATGERGRVFQRLHWLLMRQAISLDDIWARGWVPRNFRPPSKRGSRLFRKYPQIDYYERLVNESRDSSRERRQHRRLPADGLVALTLRREGARKPEPTPVSENAMLVNVGLGGAGVLIPDTDRSGADLSKGSLLVDVQDGILADVKSYAKVRGYAPVNGGLRLSLEWSEPQRIIVERVS